jgi:hypothetical protein
MTVLLLVSSANAPPPALIDTYKEDGTPSDEFMLGEKVNITTFFYWDHYIVNVTGPDGNVRFSAISFEERYSVLLADITDQVGTFTITIQYDLCQFVRETIKVRMFLVVPEPSTVMSVIAFFVALGPFLLRERRKRRD